MILFLDTTVWGKVEFSLISVEGKIIREQNISLPHSESNTILKFLSDFLGADKNKLTKVVCASGPGSFTGTRVGASIILGISKGLNIPFVFIDSNKIPNNRGELIRVRTTGKINVKYNKPAL